MRLPLARSIQSRDGALTKGAKIVNGIVETTPEGQIVYPRPGTSFSGQIDVGVSQMLASFYGLRAVIDDTMSSGTLTNIVSSPTQTGLTTTVADLPMSYAVTASGAATPRMMFKNRTNAWTMTRGGTVSAVTYADTMGSATWPVTSITRSGTVATVKTADDTGLEVGDTVTIAGAVETDYNGAQTVTAVTGGVFTPERVIPITLTRSGTTATATSETPHGLTSGTYTIAGALESAYNGSKAITVTSTTQFTYTVTVTAMASPATGTPVITEIDFVTSGKPLAINNTWSSDRTAFKAYFITAGSGTTGTPLQVGVSLRIYESAGASINGTYTITAVSLAADGSYETAFTVSGWTAAYGQETVHGYVQNPAVSSITYSGTTATLTTGSAHNLLTNDTISVTGADQAGYNVTTASITKTGATTFTYTLVPTDTPTTPGTGPATITKAASTTDWSFTYTVGGSPSSPATGTITAAVIGGTVPGIAYINGYFSVMDRNGKIWTSAADDPTSWNALDFVIAQNQDGRGVALTKSGNYLVALKEWSTEPFYDAANATGSPFSPVENGFSEVGCASGWSVAGIDGVVMFVSQGRQTGRGVVLMSGIEQQKVSTPDVDRILDADDLSTVHAFCMRLDGHALYILTLVNSAITLVYDIGEKVWMEWSSLSVVSGPAGPYSVTLTCSGNVATATTGVSHELTTGQYILISPGANGTDFYGKWYPATVTSATTFTFPVPTEDIASGGTTGSVARLSESYFRFTHYAAFEGHGLMLDAAGYLYEILPERDVDSVVTTGDIPIPFMVRSTRLDGGGTQLKRLGQLRLVGDKGAGKALLRWSDDDCESWSGYRYLDLSDEEPQLRRLGAFRRRSFELLSTDAYPARFEALELDVR